MSWGPDQGPDAAARKPPVISVGRLVRTLLDVARHEHLAAIAQLGRLTSFGLPLLVGASRKRFISAVMPSQPGERLAGSLAAHLLAVENGAAIVRVHDVAETVQALRVAQAIRGAE